MGFGGLGWLLTPALAGLAGGAAPLPYGDVAPEIVAPAAVGTNLPGEIPGRRIPALTRAADWDSPQLTNFAVPLPEANTRAHVHFQQRRFGREQSGNGELVAFNPETVLVKFRDWTHPAALRVEPLREGEALRAMRARPDVQYAELDVFQRRQFTPDDPLFGNQYHHQIIGSAQAWDISRGSPAVRIAIVDTPFQMNHPDLAGNTGAGWDVVANGPVTSAPGIVHSTFCAGMAAAGLGNGVGVAGAGTCQVLPLNINGATSEMYNATVWAANHGVRVVSISWSGANSDVLETAAHYLRTNTAGILGMSALDGSGPCNYTNQPDIYCVAMTDDADNFTGTQFGSYIDFSAPGWRVFSTATGSGYVTGSGTSYATPLFCGVVGVLMSINPGLGPDEIIGLLQATAVDLGPPGRDSFYGWGRIDFAAAATAARATRPLIANVRWENGQVTMEVTWRPGPRYSLARSPTLAPGQWQPVVGAILATNVGTLSLTDPAPPPGPTFYRVQLAAP